jgi:hypothetical protein
MAVQKSPFIQGGIISLVLVISPIVLLRFADFFIFVWIPGTAIVGWLGGGGLHDPNGLVYLLLGIVIDFVLYSIVFALLILGIRRIARPN